MATVLNRGIPGNTSGEGLARLDADILSAKPACVIAFFGMNDALNSAKLAPVEIYADNLRAIVRRCREHGVRSIVLVTPHQVVAEYVAERHPNHPARTDLNAYLARYADEVRMIVRGERILLADFRNVCDARRVIGLDAEAIVRNEANGGGRDGIHLTPAGYRLLAETIWSVIHRDVGDEDTVACFGDSLTNGVHVAGAGTATGENYPAALAALIARG